MFVLLQLIIFVVGSHLIVDDVSSTAMKGSSCGIKPFVNDLPDAERSAIESIWKDYKTGDDCTDEHQKTQNVVNGLSDEIRRKLAKLPAFLKTASSKVRRQFLSLWNNITIPRSEKIQMFRDLAEKELNTEQMKLFNQYVQDAEAKKQNLDSQIAKLSPEAKEAYKKLANLRHQEALIMNSLSNEARSQIRSLANSLKRA
uniref:DUF148 domain-containing protein n=1 Tax=Syphacia muris TaxID=451379 RepID=A0A0N5AFZ3_9BILA